MMMKPIKWWNINEFHSKISIKLKSVCLTTFRCVESHGWLLLSVLHCNLNKEKLLWVDVLLFDIIICAFEFEERTQSALNSESEHKLKTYTGVAEFMQQQGHGVTQQMAIRAKNRARNWQNYDCRWTGFKLCINKLSQNMILQLSEIIWQTDHNAGGRLFQIFGSLITHIVESQIGGHWLLEMI